MAMKLSGATDSTIMRIGKYTSLTYLTYIHTQIGALSAGEAWKMSQCFTFSKRWVFFDGFSSSILDWV